MQEAIALAEKVVGRPMNWSYREDNRMGDHIWWISDVRRFKSHYPDWEYRHSLTDMVEEIADAMAERTPG
jgi:CDP-paratose 2-epimerase